VKEFLPVNTLQDVKSLMQSMPMPVMLLCASPADSSTRLKLERDIDLLSVTVCLLSIEPENPFSLSSSTWDLQYVTKRLDLDVCDEMSII
jgi:hypothetical protein